MAEETKEGVANHHLLCWQQREEIVEGKGGPGKESAAAELGLKGCWS